jgi:hypothetical protein
MKAKYGNIYALIIAMMPVKQSKESYVKEQTAMNTS